MAAGATGAACFLWPLYRIDMAEIFSGRHGPPESALARACRTMEAIAPAVVWFDEIELGITSSASSGEQGRIFAFFLTWMQEKVRGLFVAATANRIDLLPAEMIRKGRFDKVFFVDLPHDNELSRSSESIYCAAARTVPLSKTMKEKVDQLRNWAKDRAAPASLRV